MQMKKARYGTVHMVSTFYCKKRGNKNLCGCKKRFQRDKQQINKNFLKRRGSGEMV